MIPLVFLGCGVFKALIVGAHASSGKKKLHINKLVIKFFTRKSFMFFKKFKKCPQTKRNVEIAIELQLINNN